MSSYNFNSTELPVLQPRTQCVLIPRDPNFVYAYWDYTQEDINHLICHPERSEGSHPLILRVYDITGIKFNGSNANHTWDLDVGYSTKNCYIKVWQDNADYCVELGCCKGDNHFIPLMRSNVVHAPPKTTSKRDDLIWQDIKTHKKSRPYIKENIKKKSHAAKQPQAARVYYLTAQDIHTYYMKLFYDVSKKGVSLENILKRKLRGGHWQKVRPFIANPDLIKKAHPGASEKLIEKDINENQGSFPAGSSENLASLQTGASEGRLNKRKFFFEVWTELIVHGRTEPDAAVWLNQKGIKLNPDGTFSLRYALPDGEIPLKFIAQSSDGLEQRHILTGVQREKTIGFPKMLKAFDG